jgi:hypothetical protein
MSPLRAFYILGCANGLLGRIIQSVNFDGWMGAVLGVEINAKFKPEDRTNGVAPGCQILRLPSSAGARNGGLQDSGADTGGRSRCLKLSSIRRPCSGSYRHNANSKIDGMCVN